MYAITGIIGAFLFSFGNSLLALVAIFLLHLSAILDHADGEVARYRNTCSVYGDFLDYMGHIAVYASLYMCFTFGVFLHYPSTIVIVLGGLAALSRIVLDTFYLCYGFVTLKRVRLQLETGKQKDGTLVAQNQIKSPSKRPHPGQERQSVNLLSTFLGFLNSSFKLAFGPLNCLNVILLATIIDIAFSLNFCPQYYALWLFAAVLPFMAIYEMSNIRKPSVLDVWLDVTPDVPWRFGD